MLLAEKQIYSKQVYKPANDGRKKWDPSKSIDLSLCQFNTSFEHFSISLPSDEKCCHIFSHTPHKLLHRYNFSMKPSVSLYTGTTTTGYSKQTRRRNLAFPYPITASTRVTKHHESPASPIVPLYQVRSSTSPHICTTRLLCFET